MADETGVIERPIKQIPITKEVGVSAGAVKEALIIGPKLKDPAVAPLKVDPGLGLPVAPLDIMQHSETPTGQTTHLVTRNGELVEVTSDQMSADEKAALGQVEKGPSMIEKGPLGDLIKNNPQFDYNGITPVMVQKAVLKAQERGLDPKDLNPAQILLLQD